VQQFAVENGGSSSMENRYCDPSNPAALMTG
jgi:hypothetical protein